LSWLVALALTLSASSANALCIYKGNLYAKTTLAQEFEDSSIVIRGKVLSELRRYFSNEKDGDLGVLNQIRVEQVFKGKAPAVVRYYTAVNSGGFYLDKGEDYLLFLNPIARIEWKKVAPRAMLVNYNCGQSRLWAQIPGNDKTLLNALSERARASLRFSPSP
jgi:hypothetical protein